MFYFRSATKFRGTQSKALVSQSLELMFLLFLQFSASASTDYKDELITIIITNSDRERIWPQIATNPSSPQQPVSTQPFVLEPGKSMNAAVPPNWEGKIWAKTKCTPDATTGVLSCATGGCSSFLGADCPPPTTTVAEFDLNNTGYGQFCKFSAKLERGFNLPLIVVAQGGTGTNCGAAGCSVDLNINCPLNLQVMDGDNRVVGCKNTCEVGDCGGQFSNYVEELCPGVSNEIVCLSAISYTVKFGTLSLPRTPPAPFGETNGDYDSQEGYDFSQKLNRKKKSKPNNKVIIGIIITVMSLLGLVTWKFQISCCNSFNNRFAPAQPVTAAHMESNLEVELSHEQCVLNM